MAPAETIYHVTTRDSWRRGREAGNAFRPDGLDSEGFVHCATLEQVAETATRHFTTDTDVVVLCIDPSLLRVEVRYEDTSGHGAYPHVYGPLELSAVRNVFALRRSAGGKFELPPALLVSATAPGRDAPDGARMVQIVATNYDGSPHWSHPARLLRADDTIVITATSAGLPIERAAGAFTSPFDTRGHYWPDRWFNVIRLEEPGRGLTGYYCNIAAPVKLEGDRVCYVDLQLDVRVYLGEDGGLTYAVLDEDEFEAARVRYGYDEALVANCRRAVKQVIAMVEAREFPFDGA